MELHWLLPSAAGLLLLSFLPVLAHLIRRPPTRDWAFGSMMLLQKVELQNKKRNRIQDWLLLLLRLMLLILLGLSIMQPQLRWADPNEQMDHPSKVIILMDTSLSMNQTLSDSDGRTALEWSKNQAIQQMIEAPEQVEWYVMSFADNVQKHTTDFSQGSIEAIAGVQEIQQESFRGNLVQALTESRRILDGQGGEIWLYTDEAGDVTSGLDDEISLLVQQNIALIPQKIPIENPSNLVITQANYGEGVEGGRLTFTVMNYADSAKEAHCVVSLPDGTEINTFVEVPANQAMESFVTVPRVTDGGVGTVSVEDPRLALDNDYFFQLPKIGASRVLIVDGDPGATPIDSEVYFLERALAPWGRGERNPGIVPEIVGDIGGQELSSETHSVVFMSNVSNPSRSVGALLEFVRSGGGLVLSLGSNTNVDQSNQVWAELLPASLSHRQNIATEMEYGVRTALPDVTLPLFRPFARAGLGDFGKIRWKELFVFQDFISDPNRKVLLATETGLPILVEYQVGKGKVLLFTSTLDMDWGNFPLQSVYMPLMQKIVGYLGGVSNSGLRLNRVLGEPIFIESSFGNESLVWNSVHGSQVADLQRNQIWLNTRKSGAFELSITQGPTLAWVAVNSSRVESDVHIHQPILEVAVETEPEAFMEKRDLAPWLVLVAMVFLLLQAILSQFNHPDEQNELEAKA